MQLVQLRFRAVCAVCSSKLPPRAEAWHDDDAQRTVCLSCQRIEAQAQAAVEAAEAAAEAARRRVPVPDLNRAPRLVPARPGDRDEEDEGSEPGSGASPAPEPELSISEKERLLREQVEAERRQREDAEREAIAHRAERSRTTLGIPRPKRSGNGPRTRTEPLSASPPTDVPAGERPTRLPQVGPSLAAGLDVDRHIGDDAGDNAIHRALEAARPHGLEVIRSRPWVGTRVETEAIVVGPSGVWVVDGLGTSDGPVEKGFLAGHAGSELLNVVGGRTSIISGLLFDSPYQWVPVRGALCFDSGVPAWFDAPFSLAGISITTPRDLVDALFMPLHLDADTRRAVAQHLVNRF